MSKNKNNSKESRGEEDEIEEKSNIADETPYKGMKLEIRDSDYIWSSGYLVDVIKSKKVTTVIVASDGWGRQWDEELVWPSGRLARLYTYTKRVKCMLDLVPKPKRKPPVHLLEGLPRGSYAGYSSGWPVAVQFRMPHPGNADAEELLRMEEKVFVQPYGTKLLPDNVRKTMVHDGGCWYHHGRLRLWKEDPTLMGILHKHFMEAYRTAQADKTVKGYLLPKALEKNSLLNETFRVHHVRGAKTKDGKLVPTGPAPKRSAADVSLVEYDLHDHHHHDTERPPRELSIRNADMDDHEEKQAEWTMPRYFGPPRLPTPLEITEPLYPNSGVGKAKKSNEWTASLSLNGNDVFLGSFSSQTKAWMATRKAVGLRNDDGGVEQGQNADLEAVSMEDIIDTYESKYNAALHTFSLHRWTQEKLNHHYYEQGLSKLDEEEEGQEDNKKPRIQLLTSFSSRGKKRKQSQPRRVDPANKKYVTP